MLVEHTVIVELKAVEQLSAIHEAQLLLRKSAPGRPLRARINPRPLTAEARLGSMRWVLASYAASV